MVVYEGNSDEEDGAAERSTESEATFGRFNAGRAQRRAMRREGLEYLQMMNGDDRKEFLTRLVHFLTDKFIGKGFLRQPHL